MPDDGRPPWPPRPGDDGRGNLVMWTVYERPRDFPSCYVARQWIIRREAPQATGQMIVHRSLERLRRVFIEHGFTCLARADGDDPLIVESWL